MYLYQLAQEWSIFISKLPIKWAWYCHHTFRGSPHEETADKAYMKFIHLLNREIYGSNYWKDKSKGVVFARGKELQERGAIHYHSLIGHVPEDIKRMKYMDIWNSMAGFARIYPYEEKKGAEYYLSKSAYAWKHGEIDIRGPINMQQLRLNLQS